MASVTPLLPVANDALMSTFATQSVGQDNLTEVDPYWAKLPFAHKYWHQFNIEGVPSSYHYGVAAWMTFFGILGTLGNLMVIYIFIRYVLLISSIPEIIIPKYMYI